MPLRNPRDVLAEHKRKLDAQSAAAIDDHAPAVDRKAPKRTCIELVSDDDPPAMHEI
jgi:hypothetical protein